MACNMQCRYCYLDENTVDDYKVDIKKSKNKVIKVYKKCTIIIIINKCIINAGGKIK